MGHILSNMRWTEVEGALSECDCAVLPIGAAAKEHGPHLPMQTDYLTAEALGARLAAAAEVVVWPTLGYGHYPAFRDYAGSTSVPEEVFGATVHALLLDLKRHGAGKIVVLNTGISTIRAIDGATADVGIASGVHVYRGARYLAAVGELCEQPLGGHGDEAETSVMRFLHPELVEMAAAPTWNRPVAPGRWNHVDEDSASYSPSGIVGDASLATEEKGEALVAAMLDDLIDACT